MNGIKVLCFFLASLVYCHSLAARTCKATLIQEQITSFEAYLSSYRDSPEIIKLLKKSDPLEAHLAALSFIEEQGGGSLLLQEDFRNAIEKGVISEGEKGTTIFKERSLEGHYAQFFSTYLRFGSDQTWRSKFERFFSNTQTAAHILQRKFEYDLAKHGLGAGLKSLGLHKESTRTQISDKIRAKSNYIRSTLAAGMNAFLIAGTHYDGIFLPKIDFFKGQVLSDELLERGLKHGFESIKDELAAKFKNRILFQAYYDRLKTTVNILTLSILAGQVSETVDEKLEKYKRLREAARELKESQSKMAESVSNIDLSLRYDWSDKEKAWNAIWEATLVRKETALGEKIDRVSPEWLAKKEIFFNHMRNQNSNN